MNPENLQLEPLGGGLSRAPLLRRVGIGLGRDVVPLLPFRFPTLTHLSERVADVQRRASSVEGLQPNTIGRWTVAWHSLYRFLANPERERAFIEGDYRKAVSCHRGLGGVPPRARRIPYDDRNVLAERPDAVHTDRARRRDDESLLAARTAKACSGAPALPHPK
jgi:hypothetical protein